ncbi:MAG: M20 family peptidase, partial [Mesorhizobium sp.]
MTADIVTRLRAALDPDQALALFRGAIGRESITGNEANFVGFLETKMRALG